MTGLQAFGEGDFSWDGKSKAQNLDWTTGNPSEIGDCATFNKMGLTSITCDTPSHYMCEGEVSKEKTSELPEKAYISIDL